VNSWSPLRISRFDPDFSETPETIEAPGISNPADICYAKEIDTLAIPNSGNNTVTFIGFENPLSVRDNRDNPSHFGIVGNPVTIQSYFQFTATADSRVTFRFLMKREKPLQHLSMDREGLASTRYC
jgi:hypothetical protein